MPLSAGCKRRGKWVPAGVTIGWLIVTLLADLRKAPAICQGWWLDPGSFQQSQPSSGSSAMPQAQPVSLCSVLPVVFVVRAWTSLHLLL